VVAMVLGMPAVADVEQDCFQHKDPQLKLKGCSEIIQRSPSDASAYHNRAVAHGLAGDVDKAIADYSKVIEIAPNNASAYDNRGRAYASKGDYAHAVADVTKASELAATATDRLGPTTPIPERSAASNNPPKTKAFPRPYSNFGTWQPWTAVH
jgi:tetratricopeptide (TPR) repeat protein